MNNAVFVAALILATLSGCAKNQSEFASASKADGPRPSSLSHHQLMATYLACTQYGQIDDPRVPYSAPYCAAVQSAQLSGGYAAKAAPHSDPTLTKMH